MATKKNCHGKHREFENFAKTQEKNTGNLICSSCKFPDSKGKTYLIFAMKISIYIFKVDKFDKSVLCICNSHKSRKLAQG